MARESFNSRIGFILVSAGCAIGIGNVSLCGRREWRWLFCAVLSPVPADYGAAGADYGAGCRAAYPKECGECLPGAEAGE